MADPAPLIATPAAPLPEGGRAEWFEGAAGARLRGALFPAVGECVGSVVLSPGRTEPIEKYFETVSELARRGLAVLVHDWRGQGLSARLLADRHAGHAVGYVDFLYDYEALLEAFAERLLSPWIAMGHSMGGCLTLLALANGEMRFSGAILSAPMLGLMTGGTPKLVGRAVARTLSSIGRGGMLVEAGGKGAAPPSTPFEENVVTHDRVRYARNEAQIAACPDLALGPPTWGWLDFAFSAIAVLQRSPATAQITIPVTVVAAGEERLVDNNASRQVCARLPHGRFVEVPGAFHEILQETDAVRGTFWDEFDALAARAGVSPPVAHS